MLFPDAHTAEGEVNGSDEERSPRERPEELPRSVRLINMEWQKMEERLKQPEEGPPTEASKRKRYADTNHWDNPILAATEGEAQLGRSGKRGRGGRTRRGGTGRGRGRGGTCNHTAAAREKGEEDAELNRGAAAAAASSSILSSSTAVVSLGTVVKPCPLPNGLGPLARAITEAEQRAEQATCIQGQAVASSMPASGPSLQGAADLEERESEESASEGRDSSDSDSLSSSRLGRNKGGGSDVGDLYDILNCEEAKAIKAEANAVDTDAAEIKDGEVDEEGGGEGTGRRQEGSGGKMKDGPTLEQWEER
uniref:Uncharacterized protein n=1 Tax=Chromera velia CCMP2878 TaxID=1169474 RepID=A0A0G4HAR5_9ALVE|eukprot:Cvel_6110.t1-p1 / transcript=Cvel_6110.t1 / gene=Cvel_6110 / organism=Chromera_velia_CCMP2878 / gene_product=hypothetical protein / transcript_product=hypothetical protein / location=Cvel_scaffold295:6148-7068(+) / protein_length=307 / sequence_SO=supercontig / SO=protein_coding / is_pseudo=false